MQTWKQAPFQILHNHTSVAYRQLDVVCGSNAFIFDRVELYAYTRDESFATLTKIAELLLLLYSD